MADIPESTKMLPCPNPWCENIRGVEAARHITTAKWHICCGDCLIDGPWADTCDLAIAAWNTRAAPPAPIAEGVTCVAKPLTDDERKAAIDKWMAPPAMDREAVKWRERWHGSEPEKGSAVVDYRGNMIAYLGGDEATHAAVTQVVAAHNAILSTLSADAIRQGEGSEVERFREAIVTIIGRCEALEDEASDELAKDQADHAHGFYRGQKSIAKSLRRHLADLARPITPASHASDGGKA